MAGPTLNGGRGEAREPSRFPHAAGLWLDPDTGETFGWADLIARLAGKRVILLGESHDVAEIHRWQLHVAAALLPSRPDMALGFEMFPLRVQGALDEWTSGAVTTETFLERSEWDTVWGFDPALYLPLFHFARQMRLKMLALNCRRALVTEVGKQGWDAIPVEDRDGVTPATPIAQGHRDYLRSLMRPRADGTAPPVDFASDRFVRAQQVWDRAFACRIADHLARRPGDTVIGIIGRGHLEYGWGTPWQLADLGVKDVAVLLPETAAEHDVEKVQGIGAALFRLDTPEPPSIRRAMPK